MYYQLPTLLPLLLLALTQQQQQVFSTTAPTSTNNNNQQQPSFHQPTWLKSNPKTKTLEVQLIAKQSSTNLGGDGTQTITNCLLYDWKLMDGTSSNSLKSGDGSYPAPTLQVQPGEILIIHFSNSLTGLTMRDYINPKWTKANEIPPMYPVQLTTSPINLHLHGLHVSPQCQSDNVLLTIPPGYTNTYRYEIPADHPQGLYWYHPHRHTLVQQQIYRGLVGMLSIGRPDGDIPKVTANNLTTQVMSIQYSYVPNRSGGQRELQYLSWPGLLNGNWSAATPESLANGQFKPYYVPSNFAQSKKGTKIIATPGSSSMKNIPQNLLSFSGITPNGVHVHVPADTTLPLQDRDVQFTVNGQLNPILTMAPGETQIWAMGSFGDSTYIHLKFFNVLPNGKKIPMSMQLVGQDGDPYLRVQSLPLENGKSLLISPAGRYAVVVTMPVQGSLVVELAQYMGFKQLELHGLLQTSGVLYTNNGNGQIVGVRGVVSVDPSAISYFDGFLLHPTQTLLTVNPSQTIAKRPVVTFRPGEALHAQTAFVQTIGKKVDVSRTLELDAGGMNVYANPSDSAVFAFEIEGNQFPYPALVQPRLQSIESWDYKNLMPDEHPMHVHVNTFQVTKMITPPSKKASKPENTGIDVVNVPGALLGKNFNVLMAGLVQTRSYFQDFLGCFVLHCHRNDHSDGGMMLLTNVIPARSLIVVSIQGGYVQVFDSVKSSLITVLRPFPSVDGIASAAVGDFNGDGIWDVIVGSPPGVRARVELFCGEDNFTHVGGFDIFPSGNNFNGGISVALGTISPGNATRDNIIVGLGKSTSTSSQVLIFERFVKNNSPTAPALFASWMPFGKKYKGGINVAAGMISDSGRIGIITAPAGKGLQKSVLKTWIFTLFTPNSPNNPQAKINIPTQLSEIAVFGDTYQGGMSVSSGWVAGELGGYSRIIVGQLDGHQIKIYSTGSALNGFPEMYVMSPDIYSYKEELIEMASFPTAIGIGVGPGVHVSHTSTVTGSSLIYATNLPSGISLVYRTDLIKNSTMLIPGKKTVVWSGMTIGGVLLGGG
jgi:FtsP/CotA-like multicopper oxidase with cupredoxin domain